MKPDLDDDPTQFVAGALPRRTGPRGEPVWVDVEHIGAGTWARFTGTREDDGTPLIISGAVIGGPDPVGDGVYAVAIRDYQGNPDVIMHIPAGGQNVDLADDPADDEAQVRHGLAPVFGEIERADVLVWEPSPGATSRRDGRWVWGDPIHNPTREQLNALAVPDLHLAAVHRKHLPIARGPEGRP